MLPMRPPWYQAIAEVAAAAAAAPTAKVNFFVQASFMSSATAYGSRRSYQAGVQRLGVRRLRALGSYGYDSVP